MCIPYVLSLNNNPLCHCPYSIEALDGSQKTAHETLPSSMAFKIQSQILVSWYTVEWSGYKPA